MTDETVLAETPAAETVADPTTKIEQAAPETVVEETPEAADTAEPAVEETTDADAEDDGGEKKKIPGSQRLKRKLALIESDFANVLRENEELKRRVPAPQEQRQDGRPGIDREPTEADYPNDYFSYERSRTAWEVRQSVRDEIARAQQIPQQVRQAEAQRERLIAYEESAELVRERIPDFDKVIRTAADVTIKPELIQELLASDKSALLQYHLAKNPDKARELNAMSGKELARELGRLEARIHLPTPKKATDASPPPSKLKGGAAASFDANSSSMDDYVAKRKAGWKG